MSHRSKCRVLLILVSAGIAGLWWAAVCHRASAIATTLEWGRLAPFPASAEQVSITTHGSLFTRELRTSFVASAAEIEAWLQQSPGITDAVLTIPAPGIRHFAIQPGGGAAFAEVEVDDTTCRVFIRVYWS